MAMNVQLTEIMRLFQ